MFIRTMAAAAALALAAASTVPALASKNDGAKVESHDRGDHSNHRDGKSHEHHDRIEHPGKHK